MSFVGREDIHLEEKLLKELPGIANWALAGLKRLRAAVGRFTLGDGHKRLAEQYAADTSPIMAWVRSEMAVHRRADPGDLPPECLTRENVSIGKSDAYDLYCAWCESHDIEPTRPAWFGRDLKTLIPKLQEGRDTKADGSRVHVYRGIGVRGAGPPDDKHGIKSDCTTYEVSENGLASAKNGVAVPSLSGQSGHLDCFAQLLHQKDKDTGKEKVVENNGNARTARTRPPHADSQGEKQVPDGDNLAGRNGTDSLREARRLARNLRLEYRSGYVVQPDPNDLSIWRVGKDVGGAVRWLDQFGTREWAVGEVQRRIGPKPAPPPVPEKWEDDADSLVGNAADVLNTLICDLDDGKFDMADPDDLDILECQIASASDIPETADLAESMLGDLGDGRVAPTAYYKNLRQHTDNRYANLRPT